MLWNTIKKLEHLHTEPRTSRIDWFSVEQQFCNPQNSGAVQDFQSIEVSSETARRLELGYIPEVSPASE